MARRYLAYAQARITRSPSPFAARRQPGEDPVLAENFATGPILRRAASKSLKTLERFWAES